MTARVLFVIPARMGSTRLPGKPLLKETGKYLLQHVWERAAPLGEVVLAVDDARLVDAARSFGADVVLTSHAHESGTDRVAEVARARAADLVVNLQGDEPEFEPRDVSRLVAAMLARPEAEMGTLAVPRLSEEEQARTSVVKAVVKDGWAQDFTRDPAPGAWRHVGIYAFRPGFLQEFTRLPPTARERERMLEQLRALDHGHRILVVAADRAGAGIDTPEDYAAFVARARV